MITLSPTIRPNQFTLCNSFSFFFLVCYSTMDCSKTYFIFIVYILVDYSDGYHLRGRIIDGNEAKLKQFPYHVSLYKIKGQHYFCGGAIISKRFILSAAHCFYKNRRGAESIYGVVGQVDLRRTTKNRLKFAKIRLHVQFNAEYNWNDISLLQTTDSIIFDDFTKPVALPKAIIGGGCSAIVSGFGSILVSVCVWFKMLILIIGIVFDFLKPVSVSFFRWIDSPIGYSTVSTNNHHRSRSLC